eukprot:3879138-Alexandrium_andersonii.AAC.1
MPEHVVGRPGTGTGRPARPPRHGHQDSLGDPAAGRCGGSNAKLLEGASTGRLPSGPAGRALRGLRKDHR